MSIELMLKNCKTELELRSFAEAQQKTLTQLMKKNKQLEEEVDHLKKLVVNGALPVIQAEGSVIEIGTTSEEIAKIELNKLKIRSMDSECLMLEDAKKLEIYTKILSSRYDDKQKKSEREVKEVQTENLLALVESKE